MKRIISLLMVALMLTSVMTVNSFAREVENVAYKVYVSVNGDDNTADGSSNKPFAIIQVFRALSEGV